MTVTAENDRSTETGTDDETQALAHAFSGADYGNVSASVSVAVKDKDANGVAVNPAQLKLNENGSGTYKVRLSKAPASNVTVAIAASSEAPAGHGVTTNPSSLTFTANDYSTPKTVTVFVADDKNAVDETAGDTRVTLTHTLTGYTGAARNVAVDTVEDDKTGVIISRTSVTINEGGNAVDGYTVKLNSQPSANVTVTIGETPTTNDLTVTPDSLLFTTTDWSSAKTVRLTAAEDNDAANDKVTLAHSVTGGDYSEHAADSVTVTITDNDKGKQAVKISKSSLSIDEESNGTYTVELATEPSAAVTVSVDAPAGLTANPTSLSFSADDWDAGTVTITANADADAVDNTLTVTHKVTSAGDYKNVTAASVTVTVDDNDTAGVTLDPTSVNINETDTTATGTYTVVLTAAPPPNQTARIAITSDNSDVTVDTDLVMDGSQNTLSFTSADYSTARTVTVTVSHDGDGKNDTAKLTHAISGYSGLASDYASPVVTVNVTDDDSPSIGASTGSLTVVEGDSRTYTIKLGTTPTEPVTVKITSSDTSVVVSPASVTLSGDAATTTGATIKVSVPEDADAVAPSGITLTHAFTTEATEYPSTLTFTNSTVNVTLVENDEVGVTVTPAGIGLLEGTYTTYTVVLDSEPSGTVTVTISGASGEVSINKSSLTFTTSNWDEAQTVEVTASHDGDTDEDTATLAHSFSGGDYDGQSVSVPVTVEDDDAAGVLANPTKLRITEGSSSTVSVRLTKAPTADVVLTFASGDDTAVTVSPASLTFTSGNWDTAQSIKVSAIEDTDTVSETGDNAVALNVTSPTTGYNQAGLVSVDTVDNDGAALTVSPLTLSANEEGDSVTYAVSLATKPTGTVIVTVSSDNADVVASPDVLTFAPGTFSTEQSVTVTAKADDDGDDDTADLTHSIRGYDALPSNYKAPKVVVTVTDNDEKAINVSPSSLIVSEGSATGSTYQVSLASAPSADVTVAIVGKPEGLVITPATLSFTTTNSAVSQKVTVTAPDGTVTGGAATKSFALTHKVTTDGATFNGNDPAVTYSTVEVHEKDSNVQGKPVITAASLLKDSVLTADTTNVVMPNGLTAGSETYQWKRGAADISGADAKTYTAVAADVGQQISVVYGYTDKGGIKESVTSDAVMIYDPAKLAPVLSQSNGVLMVDVTDIMAAYKLSASDISYQWTKNGTVLDSVTGPRLTIGTADDNAKFVVKVTFTHMGETVEKSSTALTADVAATYSPGLISEIRPAIRGVTISSGEEVQLGIVVYGLQGVIDSSLVDGDDDVSVSWTVSQGDVGMGALDGDGTRIRYTAPSSAGTYTVTASLSDRFCRPDDESMREEKCSAAIDVRVRRAAPTQPEAPAPVNPPGEIPSILTDGDGNQYEVFTPEGGGAFAGVGYSISADAGSVPNNEYIGIRVSDEGAASNAGMTHQRYTLGGNMYAISAVDSSGATISAYQLSSAAEVCLPLPAELRTNISDLAIVTINADDTLTILAASVRLSSADAHVCGNLSALPASVAVGNSGAPAALPTATPMPEPETPDTGGTAPTSNAGLWILLLGTAIATFGTLLVIARRRESARK